MKYKLLFCLFVAVSLVSCNNESDENNGRKEIILSRSEEKIVNLESDFAFDLISNLYMVENEAVGDDMNNIIVSPLSMFVDFSMLANGGSPAYQEKIINFLKVDDDIDINNLNNFNKRIVDELLKADRKVQFTIANAIFTHTTVDLKNPFVESLNKYYNATTMSLDFDDRSAVDKVNDWARSSTKGLIPTVLEYGSLNSDNVFALCNALYFEGSWSFEINKDNTKPMVFYNQNGEESQVLTMQTVANNVAFVDDMTVVKKDYGNRAFSMYFILPDSGISLGSTVFGLNGEKWAEIKSESMYYPGQIYFPKYKIDYGFDSGEKGLCQGLGIDEIMYNPDLTEMTDTRIERLKLIQNNTIDVDETGGKAAAATVVTGDPTCAMPEDPETPIYINRPFMFVIEENSTGVILFAGLVMNL